MNKKNTIGFVAGRSGGHLIPALTLAKKACEKNKYANVIFFTTNMALDQKIVQDHTYIHTWIPIPLGNVPTKKIYYPFFLFNLLYSFLKSLYHLLRNRPSMVISMGGYISIPVCIAAYILRIPINLYELNVTPGKAITFLSKIATNIYVCFKSAVQYLPQKKCRFTQYPVRFKKKIKETSQKKTSKTILILGGSQGSLTINTMIKKWVEQNSHTKDNINIIHQTGNYDTTDWHEFYKKNKITATTFDFNHDIKKYYQAADVIICRSGAGTLFETIFFKKKFITIPLETSTTAHQLDNAREIQKLYPDLVTVIRQKEIDASNSLFFDTLQKHLR